MAVQASTATRSPRGTKTLTQAFFAAADGIPEEQRAAVVKAALSAIRGQLKDLKDKAKAAKDKAKLKSAKASIGKAPKPTPAVPKKAVIAVSKPVIANPAKKLNAKIKRAKAPASVPAEASETETQ